MASMEDARVGVWDALEAVRSAERDLDAALGDNDAVQTTASRLRDRALELFYAADVLRKAAREEGKQS